jgi:NAD(P)-dependent dehydrogenase (short-subunit alcohol dehydrogenase family)
MGTYAVTGSASGMGKAAADRLRTDGHTVIGVDLKDVEIVADLSTSAGRADAAARVLTLAGGILDGAVLAAGLGPVPGRERLIGEVNYFGVVDLLTAWRPALAAADSAKVVVFSSNSTTTVPLVPGGTVRGFLAGNLDRAIRPTKKFGKNGAAFVYAGSKIAVTRWMRRTAVTKEWAGAGIRLNAIAPGAILTPLLQRQLDDPATAGAVNSFPVPIGGFGTAESIADWVAFMLSPNGNFLVGAVIVVDGGSDAYFRSDDWPVPVPVSGVLRYFQLSKKFRSNKGIPCVR